MASMEIEPWTFATLANLGKTYRDARTRANREEILSSIPPDASMQSLGSLGLQLIRAGDSEGGIALARLADASRRDERDYGLRREQFDLTKRQADATLEGSKVPPGFRQQPTGGLTHIPGGPADPEYIRSTTEARDKGKQFNAGEITKLVEEGGKFSNLANFNTTFQDRFAGYKVPGVGNAAMAAGRYVPGVVGLVPGLNEQDVREGAQWWQGYDRYKNIVRNDLFGSALTANEQAAFERADINPGMDPGQIRKNLDTQQSILNDAMKRKAGALTAGGYPAEPIARAYGLKVEDLGVEPKRAAPTAPAGPATQLAPRPLSRADVEVARKNPQQALQEARDALAKNAPRDAVIRRLQQLGVNPADL